MKKKFLAILFLLVLALPCFAVSTFNVSAQENHTVTFMVDGEVYATDTVASGDTIKTIPATPIKNGSVFEYWALDGEKFSFVNEITQDLVLNAKWEELAVYYKVQFMVNGVVVNTQEVEKGQPAVEPKNPELPEGKSFVRWDADFSSITENTVINAVLDHKSYTVSIYNFSGGLYDMISVPHGETVTNLPQASTVPVVEHYVFSGYDYDGSAITEDTDIKMIYTPEVYTVTFEIEGQTAPDTQQVKYGGTVKFPSTPSQENYIFVGWYIDSSNQAYDFNAEVDRDLHLVARFIPIEKPKYQVNFYTHDGVQYGGTQMIEEGQSAIQPGNPSRYGYTFIGWTEDFTSVTTNLDVYPIYQINEYTVKFIVDGNLFDTQTVKYGDSAKEPDQEVPQKEGYDFIGWDSSLKNIISNVEINAMYRVKTFAVMFYDEYNKKIGATQYVEYGKSAVVPKLGEKVGYTFDGWSDGATTSLDAYKVITQDVTFIAEYTILTYTVTFYEGYQVKHQQTVDYGGFAPMYTYTNGDQLFVGWFADNQYQEAFDFSKPITKNVELYASWQDKPILYHTVSFCVDNEVYFQFMVADQGSVSAPAVPYKEGYNFVGWKYYNKLQQEELDYTGNVAITEDLVVNAVFEIKKHTVTFYFGDNEFKQVLVEHGKAPEFPTEEETEMEGYEFMGWGQQILFVHYDMVVYARYERIGVGVTFIVPDEGQYAVQNLYYGEYARVVSAPSKTGYTFDGWYTDREFTTQFSFSTPITESVWLYAKFTVNEYAIIYYLDGVMHLTEYFEYGATIKPLGDVQFDGNRIFLGWSEIPQIMPAQTVIVTGSSKQLGTYKISYYINSKLYETVEYVEGKAVQPLDAPTNLDETIVFNGWRNEPTEMPAYDVTVHADVENLSYYNIYYYVNGRFNISQMVLQGRPVVAPERPQGTLPENEVFNGWINVPEFMPANHIRIDADITFLEYYTVRYYIDGYARFVQQALEGKKFIVMQNPSNALQEDTIFNYWTYDVNGDGNPVRVECGSSLQMPSHDIEIHANVTKLQYYYIKYYIGDLLYHSRMVLEGKTVTPFNAPSNLPETTVFHAWLNEPEVMPNHDVRVEADYTKYEYYVLSFYVGDRFYCSERLLEGKPFSLPDAPTDLPENIVFECWDYLGDFIMPNHDLTIYANYRELHEYVISYYINGTLYWTQTVLEGKPVEVIDAPIETPDNIVFISWGYVPEFMPSENVTINAEIRILQEYEIRYYVNGSLYTFVKVLEGKAVTPMGPAVDLPDYIVFNGWLNEPSIMPNHDVEVHADITILSNNMFVVTFSEIKDGYMTVTLEVQGMVNFAGFLAEITYDPALMVSNYWFDEENGWVYGADNGNKGKIVWSKGVNTTEQTTFVELEFYVGEATTIEHSQVAVNILDVVVIDDNGNVVQAEYSLEYKNK